MAGEPVRRAGSAYYVQPDDGPGPGVLLLHSWWGLTDAVKAAADALADAGFTVVAPDLLAGARPQTSAEAEMVLGAADMDASADLVLSSVHALRSYSAEPRDPVGVVGWAMGASWAMWVSARLPESVRAVVGFYGTQSIDFEASVAEYQLHFAQHDEIVGADDVAETRALLGLAGRPVEVHTYEGVSHGFVEPDASEAYEAAAASTAWQRALDFLHERLACRRDPPGPGVAPRG